ncbi:response regulator [Nitrospira sp. NS4]|uniref:response regulator n=1 Tax=Nitrospira sp. NS4 TaxID=3414498 RepID=UPI003C2CA016
MTASLRLLQLEANPDDADHIVSILTEGGIACQAVRVDRPDTFLKALKRKKFDAILADYSIPGFDGLTALTLARQICPDIPFLFVTTTLGKDLAIDAVKRGATDYILKQRLGRLVPSIHRALRELEDRLERKRVEQALRQSEKQLRQAQKLEAVGRLAGGLAHDFNNLLTVIMGHGQGLLGELHPDDPVRGRIQEIHQAGDRAAALIRQLLTFSRQQPSKPKVLSLNPLITNFETMMRRLIGEDLDLTIALSPQDLQIRADPAQIEQVLMNLVVNARDAMPKGGQLVIHTALVELAHTPMYYARALTLGPYVRLSVADTGRGMAPEVLAHIFEPFFTSRHDGRGTGLGLSMVYGIVTQSGGGIDVSSQVGQGSRFDVYFPSMQSRIVQPPPHEPFHSSIRGHETLLLVEDDQSVRELVRDGLRTLGYRVIESRNGLEACLIASQQIGNIQMLITDVVMPGMSGTELAQHLRILKPDLKLLFISGYADDIGIGSSDPSSDYLQKPFTPELIAQRIRQLLDHTAETRQSSPVHELSTH